MDKFAVIKEYKYSSPDVVDTFGNLQDAVTMAEILGRRHDDYKYHVFQLVELPCGYSTFTCWRDPQNLLLLRSTMKQYWYFGVRMKKSIPGATGMRSVTLWAPTAYNTAADAAQAAAKAMVSRAGVSFFIQGFDRRLIIQPDGTSSGFEETMKGVQ